MEKKVLIMYSRMVLDAIQGKNKELNDYLTKNADNLFVVAITTNGRYDDVVNKLKCAPFKSAAYRAAVSVDPHAMINEVLMKFPEYNYEDVFFVISNQFSTISESFLIHNDVVNK